MTALKKIYIGTSGWSYIHWKENFYPKEIKQNHWLDYYATEFPTVEVNTTFYHLPLKTTIDKWHKQIPSNFQFSIKASRYITHQKKLHDCKESVNLFLDRIEPLKPNLGPILFQLPPSFKIDIDRLTEFLTYLTANNKYTFEFRHESWFTEEIYELLSKNNIALCITDLNGHLTPEEVTSDMVYIRLHGPKNAYKGTYGLSKLKIWKKKVENWALKASVYCYFDNDEKGFAIQDAKTLSHLIHRSKDHK